MVLYRKLLVKVVGTMLIGIGDPEGTKSVLKPVS